MAGLAPPPASARPRIQPWIWRLQALLTAYLPLLLMAVLASGTWWLVKNTPLADEPTEAAPPRHEPDYRMKNFELQRVGVDGRLRVRIEGSEMRHYPDDDTLEIDGVRVRAYNADGTLTLATASRALANGDGSEMQLLGGVHVQSFEIDAKGEPKAVPKLEVRGEFLHALVNSEQLRSHLPVVLNYAGGELHAQSFEYDNAKGQLRFRGHTSGRFATPATPGARNRSAGP